MKQKKTSALTALAIASAVMLAACGGGGGGSDSAGAAAPASSPSGGSNPQTSIPPKTSVPPTTFPATSVEAAVFAQLNANRLAMGVGELSQDSVLDTAAAKHSLYLSSNLANGSLTQPSHDEVASLTNFYAATPLARAQLAGAPATEFIDENLTAAALQATNAAIASDCVTRLFATVYHLQGLTGPVETIGIGIGQTSTIYTCVLDAGQTTGVFGTPAANGFLESAGQQMPTNAIATWPLPNATGASTTLSAESPNPAPDLTAAGTPVMYKVNAANLGDVLTVTSFTLTAPNGTVVPARIIVPSAALTGSTAAATADVNSALADGVAFLLPLAPLSPNTTYTVSFSGARDGTPTGKTWSFTTGAN